MSKTKFWMITKMSYGSNDTSISEYNTRKEMLEGYEEYGKLAVSVRFIQGKELFLELVEKDFFIDTTEKQ